MNTSRDNKEIFFSEVIFLTSLGFTVIPYGETEITSKIFYKNRLVGYITLTENRKIRTSIDCDSVIANYTQDDLNLGITVRELFFKNNEEVIKLSTFHNEINDDDFIILSRNHEEGYNCEYTVSFENESIISEAILANGSIKIRERGSNSKIIESIKRLFPNLMDYYFDKHSKSKSYRKNN